MNRFPNLRQFVVIIGNARSGTSLLGSIIDAHPNAMVANETSASRLFWNSLSAKEIFEEIHANAEINRKNGRHCGGYSYSITQEPKNLNDIHVAGDKIWNPAMLLLHGDYRLLHHLETILETNVSILHAIRNPFDTVATMHARSGAPVLDRIAWYFNHCEAASAIRQKARCLDVYHEDVIASPEQEIVKILTFLGLLPNPAFVAECKTLLFKKPKLTRYNIAWTPDELEAMNANIRDYDFLHRYSFDSWTLTR